MCANAQAKKPRNGYVRPQTGPLSAFSADDRFKVEKFLATARGLDLNVEVVVKDSQSNPNCAAEEAKELISRGEVKVILVSSTPESTNPVFYFSEQEEIPNISTLASRQPRFIGQQGNSVDAASRPEFDYDYHFFWGLEDNVAAFMNMWDSVSTNKKIGAIWPCDGCGNAWASDVGKPPLDAAKGYEITDPCRYQNLTDNFSAWINAFKQAGCKVMTGIPILHDFTTSWAEAKQPGFNPNRVSVDKALLFYESVAALGEIGRRPDVRADPRRLLRSTPRMAPIDSRSASFPSRPELRWSSPPSRLTSLEPAPMLAPPSASPACFTPFPPPPVMPWCATCSSS